MKSFKEECEECARKQKEWQNNIDNIKREAHRRYLIERGIDPDAQHKPKEPQYDSIYTMDNTTATILYVIIMIAGSIFYDRWLIWIVATIIWIKHLARHKFKK